MVYFDNAATTYPKPNEVIKAVNNAFVHYGANPGRSGHKLSVDTARQVYECRELVADFFGCKNPEQVVFTQNCTHALNLAIKGILRVGDHAIISDIEHNSVLRPIHTLKERGAIAYAIAPIDLSDDVTVENFRRLIKPNTKLIAVSHGSNVFGIRSPIEKLAKLAHENGCYFLVDAAQTAGVVEIDMEKTGIDFLCAAGHKSLYGPMGTGILIAAKGEDLCTIIEGGSGSASLDYNQPDFMPDKLESGTLNAIGIVGLKAGINFVKSMGIPAIYNHEMKIAREIYSRIACEKNVQLYTPYPVDGVHLPVISFNIIGRAGEETAQLLDEKGYCLRGGYHCAPLAHKKFGTLDTGAARISIGAFNNLAQAAGLASEIKKL